jgi:chromosomal replication initiator protein
MQSTIKDEQACSAEDQVSSINEALAQRVGTQKFRIWFKNSTKLSLSDGYLKVGVPNLFMASWLENHFLEHISHAARVAIGVNPKVTFSIDPELSGQHRRTRLDNQVQPVKKSKGKTSNKGPRRTGRVSRKRLKLSLDTFIVGSSNQLAFNAAKAVVSEQQSPFNPLFIHGGYGVGKTHLLQGSCNGVSAVRPETRGSYLSAEDFVNQFVLGLKTKKLEAFRRRLRQMDLLAIDDIHFLASKPSTQEEFLHTFNTISLAGKQVVMVSDAHPKLIGQLSEKLVNRFVSGMVVKIDAPDFQTRCEICRQYASTMRKEIGESVIRYIAEHLRTNVRELEGALLKLIAFASLQNKKPTLSMAREVLAEHLARTDPIVHISDIESVVATYFGTTPANIHSPKKDRTVALARHFSMYLARKHTRMSSSEIGRFMGGKNHATVLLACRKIEDLVKQNSELHWQGSAGNKVAKARSILAKLEENVAC